MFGFIRTARSQSDYEIVQNFKINLDEIESQINNATSLDELKVVAALIERLKQESAEYKDLLDKSLYPGNYDKSFQKLNTLYVRRQEDFATIEVLQTEVVELVKEVKSLTTKSNEINAMIEKLEMLRNNEKKTIAELENLVAELRSSLHERDILVLDMMDKLIPPIMREKATLSRGDINIIRRLEKKENVLANIKVSIEDNMRFLEATSLDPGDIKEIRAQQEQFATMWEVIGPKLEEIYAENSSKANELIEIDSLFHQWFFNSVSKNVWRSINSEFKANGINLIEFSNSNEFVNSVNLFIEDEIKNLGVKSDEASEKTYVNFTDSTWFKVVKPAWIPYLIEGDLFSIEQKDEVEAEIQIWKDELYPSKWWLYVILWVLITVIVIPILLLIIKKRKQRYQAL
jgi:hypothetical protein